MLRKKITSNLLLTLPWLVVVTLLRWDWQWSLIWFWLGGFAGSFLPDIDHLLYVYFIHPEESSSVKATGLLRQGQLKEAVVFLTNTAQERVILSFHNVLSQVFFYALCFWVLTSTGSLFVKGMVMAASLHLLRDEVLLLISGQENLFRQNFFWQIKKEFSSEQLKIYVFLAIIAFVVLSFFLI